MARCVSDTGSRKLALCQQQDCCPTHKQSHMCHVIISASKLHHICVPAAANTANTPAMRTECYAVLAHVCFLHPGLLSCSPCPKLSHEQCTQVVGPEAGVHHAIDSMGTLISPCRACLCRELSCTVLLSCSPCAPSCRMSSASSWRSALNSWTQMGRGQLTQMS